ncbi:MAG: metal-dependent hydrolase [Candidatus Thorarchaeota archaeon]
MPDILTHIFIGAALALFVRGSIKDESSIMIILGSILIDIERPLTWLLDFVGYGNIGLTMAFHSVLGAILLSYAAASLFDEAFLTRKYRFMYLLVGTQAHLLLDMIMYPWEELGLYLLFPLRIPFSFHLLWPDYPIYPLLGLALLSIALCYLFIRNYYRASISE